MTEYAVSFDYIIEADNPEKAAAIALELLVQAGSVTAVVSPDGSDDEIEVWVEAPSEDEETT